VSRNSPDWPVKGLERCRLARVYQLTIWFVLLHGRSFLPCRMTLVGLYGLATL